MGNSAKPHWAEKNGRRCFLQLPHYNQIVTGKDLTHFVKVLAPFNPGLESVSLVTNSITATAVIPGSVLVLEDILITGARVEMWQCTDGEQIMVVKTSKLWATFLFNNKESSYLAPKGANSFFLSKAKHKRDYDSQVMSNLFFLLFWIAR